MFKRLKKEKIIENKGCVVPDEHLRLDAGPRRARARVEDREDERDGRLRLRQREPVVPALEEGRRRPLAVVAAVRCPRRRERRRHAEQRECRECASHRRRFAKRAASAEHALAESLRAELELPQPNNYSRCHKRALAKVGDDSWVADESKKPHVVARAPDCIVSVLSGWLTSRGQY